MAKNKGKAKDELDIDDIEIDDEAPAVKSKKKAPKDEAATKSTKTKASAETEAKPKNKPPGREPLPEGYVTAEDLAVEFGKEPRGVRQVLRDNEIEKPANGRWAWHQKKDAAVLKEIRTLLKGGSKKEKEAPAVTEAPKKGKKAKAAEVEPEVEVKKGKKSKKA